MALAALVLAIAMLGAAPCRGGDMSRWSQVLDRMQAQRVAVNACRVDGANCVPEARAAVALLGEREIGRINRAVNQLVRRKADRADTWSDPFATLSRMEGDCDDYAILKYFLLREIGYAPVLLIVERQRQHHMVVSIRTAGDDWIVLDNLTNNIVPFERYAAVWKVEKAL